VEWLDCDVVPRRPRFKRLQKFSIP
jgi:hypothetical protein